MSVRVSIIDYGVGNLLNVVRAFEHCGCDIDIVTSTRQIENAERLVLPGVGAFPDAMQELKKEKMDSYIIKHANSGKPLLGICLGMQMLFNSSEEFRGGIGLGLIGGEVVAIPDTGANGESHKIPHIGWNELLKPPGKSWHNSFLQNIKSNQAVYFVHSFMAMPEKSSDLLAFADYDGRRITAVIQRENIMGCQFHPEKSGEIGLQIIQNFLVSK